MFDLLDKCHPHMTAYQKKAIPDRLHYRNNPRVQPIILLADEGWMIIQRGDLLPTRQFVFMLFLLESQG